METTRRGEGRASAAASLAVLLAATLWYAAPLLRSPQNWSHWDWDKELALAEAQRRAVLEHGEMPLWNPYKVGGTPMFAFHESIVLAPTFPLILASGTVLGMKLRVVAGYLFGVAAMWALARRWGAHPWAASASSVIAMLSGYLASHMWFGQPMWISVGFIPVAMIALDPARRRPILLAVSFVMMFLEGGLDVLFMVGLLLAVVTLVEAIRGDPWGLLTLAGGTAGFFVLGAVKVLGTMSYIARAPRPVGHEPGFGWLHQMRGLRQIATALMSTGFLDELPWRRGRWQDMAFVGVLAVALGMAGILLAGRKGLPWSIGVAFCFLIAMDDGGIPGLWTAFHSLPVVEQFEYPLRFLGIGVVPFAAFAAMALTRLARARFRLAGVLAVALGASAALVPLVCTRAILALVFWNAPMRGEAAGEFFQWRPPHSYMAFPAILMNRGDVTGILATFRPVRVKVAESPGYRGEAYLDRSEAAAVRISRRTMNRLWIDVDAPAADLLVVNTSYAPGWFWGRAPAVDHEGLLAFLVPAGRSSVEVRYGPFDYRLGLFVSLASVAALVAVRASGVARAAGVLPGSRGAPR